MIIVKIVGKNWKKATELANKLTREAFVCVRRFVCANIEQKTASKNHHQSQGHDDTMQDNIALETYFFWGWSIRTNLAVPTFCSILRSAYCFGMSAVGRRSVAETTTKHRPVPVILVTWCLNVLPRNGRGDSQFLAKKKINKSCFLSLYLQIAFISTTYGLVSPLRGEEKRGETSRQKQAQTHRQTKRRSPQN